MARPGFVFAGIAGESLSNRTTSRLGTGLFRCSVESPAEWVDLSPRLCDAPEVRAIAVAPDDPATVYVGTQLGIHRTTDAGEHWEQLAAPAPEFGAWSIAIAPWDPATILAGYDPNRIVRSTDRGATWTEAAMPASYPACTSHEVKRVIGLALDPRDRAAYAAVEVGGVLRSDDGAAFAPAELADDPDVLDLHAVAVARTGVLAIGREGVLRSTDGRRFAPVLDDSLELAGIERAELLAIVEQLSSERFAGNLGVRRIEHRDGALRVALGARRSSRVDYGDAYDPAARGARRNAEGRERPAACWHAVASVLDACYARRPSLAAATAFVRFADAAAFRALVGGALTEPCTCNEPAGAARTGELRRALAWHPVEQYCRSIAVADPDTVYVGAGASWLAEHGTIYCSRDGGATFRPLALPDAVASTVFGVAAAGTRLAAVTKQGQLLVSPDAGGHWSIAELPAEAHPVYALAVT